MKHPFFLSLGERIHKLPDSEWNWEWTGWWEAMENRTAAGGWADCIGLWPCHL